MCHSCSDPTQTNTFQMYRCLGETGGDHLLVPITINYERIPEQSIFAAEAAGGARCQLSIEGLLFWLMVR